MESADDNAETFQTEAANKWFDECRRRFEKRFPGISFEADYWPTKDLHASRVSNTNLALAVGDFKGKDSSFRAVLRCIVAEVVLDDQLKTTDLTLTAFRVLKDCRAKKIFDLRLNDLGDAELRLLEMARSQPTASGRALAKLQMLGRHIERLVKVGVLPPISYRISLSIKGELMRLTKTHRTVRTNRVREVLDHRVEALWEATRLMLENDQRLSNLDRVALAMAGMEMCAPSRVNEILCLSKDDHVELSQYISPPAGVDLNVVHNAHQQLIITMKGSKGAQWGAKPALNFMIMFFNKCLDIVLSAGKRSRAIAEWYENNPNSLYLPASLSHLRGNDLSPKDLWSVMYFEEIPPASFYSLRSAVGRIFEELKEKKLYAIRASEAAKGPRHCAVTVLPWNDVEQSLLKRVNEAFSRCRRVTTYNQYEGKLSNMLFLFDFNSSPYLPSSAKYATLRSRLKQSEKFKAEFLRKGYPAQPTIFEKLGITMPVNGEVQIASIDTHDPRRWLTTQALRQGDKLSDVLINGWARRVNLDELRSYDFRTAEQKADQSAMPDIPELHDLSGAITSAQKIGSELGELRTEIVTVHNAGISVTSMDAITAAAEDRPVARTSEQVIILYPSWFGVCVHQHHETPCRSYGSCLPCDNNLVVKGHLPTNEAIRTRRDQLHRSIVGQLERLITAQNRGIPDFPDLLDGHVMALVEKGLDLHQMAADLIERFHELKHAVDDVNLRNKLEEALVATGMVVRIDNESVSSGALMKYHNPARHASPGLELGIEAHGGRAQLNVDRAEFLTRHPIFSPTSKGLIDQRPSLADLEEDDIDQHSSED